MADPVHTHPSGFELADLGASYSRPVEGIPGAIEVIDALSEDECTNVIQACENLGFTPASLTTPAGPVMRLDLRDNYSLMFICNHETLNRLAKRVIDCLPAEIDGWVLDLEAPLNKLFRVYRYEAHQKFAPHLDGSYCSSDTRVSMMTMLVYLNEDFEGGTTTFFPEGRLKLGGPTEQVEPVDVHPVTGNILLFPHGLATQSPLHQGTRHLSEGKYKYVLRTDVMFTMKK